MIIYVAVSRIEEAPTENYPVQEETMRVEILKQALIQRFAEIPRSSIQLHFLVLKVKQNPPEIKFFVKSALAKYEIHQKMYKSNVTKNYIPQSFRFK